MKEYPKINTCFKRDLKGNILIGEWSDPVFEYLADNKWVFTEKVDGTNIRIMWNGEKVSFGGKTDAALIPAFLANRLNDLFGNIKMRQLFKETFKDSSEVCLYGEGYGAKIQQGCCYKSDGQDFVLFDVKIGYWWLERENVQKIAMAFGIGIVPVIGAGTLQDAIRLTEQGQKSQWGDFLSEGIVARPKVELKTRNNYRVITKIKHKDFAKLAVVQS